jgi:hypothetical protein
MSRHLSVRSFSRCCAGARTPSLRQRLISLSLFVAFLLLLGLASPVASALESECISEKTVTAFTNLLKKKGKQKSIERFHTSVKEICARLHAREITKREAASKLVEEQKRLLKY